jgi:hypothetical protein
MVTDRGIRRDGLLSALGGQDSGRSPILLRPDQIAFGVNITLRGGFPTSRPPFEQKALIFENLEQARWFRENRLQGAKPYYARNGRTVTIVSVGGRFFAIDVVNDFAVSEITPIRSTTTAANFVVPAVGASVVIQVTSSAQIWVGYPIMIGGQQYIVTSISGNNVTATNVDDTPTTVIVSPTVVNFLDVNDPTLPIVWFEQAQEWMVGQNGEDRPFLYNGGTSRRSDVTKQEVPTGTAMVFNEEIQRLVVAVEDNQIVIGDILGGPTTVIEFTENGYLNEGFPFQIPMKYGKIVGLTMIANLDRSNGQGPMLVFAERGISTFNLPAARATWKDLNYPVQVNMPIRYSATSHTSIVDVNGDVFYRAKDGLRSFVYAVRQFGAAAWGNKPQSRELSRVLKKDTESLLKYTSGILFDNRLLFTVIQKPTDNGIAHKAIAALDFDLVNSIHEDVPPVYEGVWVGMTPSLLMTGEYEGQERAFAFVINSQGHNEMWEILKTGDFDNKNIRITSIVESRAMSSGNPVEMTRLLACELYVENARGLVTIDLKWRPDSYPCWFDWKTGEICFTHEDCTEDPLVCKTLAAFQPGYRTRLGFGTPPDLCEVLDNKPARLGYDFAIRLAWMGKMGIRKFMLKSQMINETEYPECIAVAGASEAAVRAILDTSGAAILDAAGHAILEA